MRHRPYGARRVRKAVIAATAAGRAPRRHGLDVAVLAQFPDGAPVVAARCGRGGLAAPGGPVQIECVLLGEGHGSTVRRAPGARHAD
ncbi:MULTISPECIES: hypothetical protein [Streptomyces violaceusniger group]|uniref:Uncharacterized protein n=1 Tax=Streptomyces antimycoticus TaxID=68175 RepID=A0ABD5J8A9_9ACTN|nr:hypothetical protein [Streptomyces violaceusniger]MEE4584001.1 hypothetical protein [Streptomyces sp. DSM 41602]